MYIVLNMSMAAFLFYGLFLYSSHTKFPQFPTETFTPSQNNASVFSRYRGQIFCHGFFYNTMPNAVEVNEHSWIFIKAVKTRRNKCLCVFLWARSLLTHCWMNRVKTGGPVKKHEISEGEGLLNWPIFLVYTWQETKQNRREREGILKGSRYSDIRFCITER